MWHSRLRIQCCHCSGLGRCYGKDLIPGLGISTCYRYSQKKKKYRPIPPSQTSPLTLPWSHPPPYIPNSSKPLICFPFSVIFSLQKYYINGLYIVYIFLSLGWFFCLALFLFLSFQAYGHSQARGQIRSAAACLHHSHSNATSATYTTAQEQGQGLIPRPHGY